MSYETSFPPYISYGLGHIVKCQSLSSVGAHTHTHTHTHVYVDYCNLQRAVHKKVCLIKNEWEMQPD